MTEIIGVNEVLLNLFQTGQYEAIVGAVETITDQYFSILDDIEESTEECVTGELIPFYGVLTWTDNIKPRHFKLMEKGLRKMIRMEEIYDENLSMTSFCVLAKFYVDKIPDQEDLSARYQNLISKLTTKQMLIHRKMHLFEQESMSWFARILYLSRLAEINSEFYETLDPNTACYVATYNRNKEQLEKFLPEVKNHGKYAEFARLTHRF